MFKNLIINFFITLVTVAISLVVYQYFFTKKIGYVRLPELLSKYVGMTSTNEQFESEVKIAKGNLDTLKSRYLMLFNKLNRTKAENDKMKIAEKNYYVFEKTADEQLKKRKQELLNKVIIEINAYVEDYGQKNNYKLILGGNGDGSVLYGEKKDDLTETLIENLNLKYAALYQK